VTGAVSQSSLAGPVFVANANAASQLAARLREKLEPSLLEVLDESAQHAGHAGSNGTAFGTHFRVRIASPFFTGKSRVARHRLVYDSLQIFIDQGVHAIAIETP
jgi:BolA family transcriptional regulator, general stress-responsive regulator